MITYPTRRLLAVMDDPAEATAAAAALVEGGLSAGDVEVLVGADGRDRLGRLGPKLNVLSRIVRVFQYLSMDQLPDFLVYEAALEQGRAVLAARVASRDRMLAVRDVLVARGGHFINYFGRLWTEELTLWRGPEPSIPEPLRR